MAPNPPRLAQLADEISRNTTLLIDYLKLDDLPQPSFEPDGPLKPVPDSHVAASTARDRPIEATRELHTLAVGPCEATTFFCFNEVCLLAALQVLRHFNVPQSVPQTGDVSFVELASMTGLSEALLPRFLRMAMSNYYFFEPRPGYVTHNPWSRILATVTKFVDMVEGFPNSSEPQDTAFHLFVSGFSGGDMADSAGAVAEAYPWNSLPPGSLVMDVQDFEDLKDDSSKLVKGRRVADRVSFTPHDFFERQPIATRDAAVFFLRNIMHDWSDLCCRRILNPIVDAMGPGSRIIISDIVLLEINTGPKFQEARVRALDLTMLSLFNAKERSCEDWERLFTSVDSRLKITSVIGKPKLKRDSIIEVQLVGK
ncbi:hypothetical protein OQA88_9270 [Cercophora sp. LCS_1]